MKMLAQEQCEPCRDSAGRLDAGNIGELLAQLDQNWQAREDHHLERRFSFNDFKDALAFTNRIGELAESQGHHPEILLGWGKVVATLWTHSVDGLTRADFVLASKIDQIAR
jgi:4a-hydroxytetrahydrobiopterin dehydratase